MPAAGVSPDRKRVLGVQRQRDVPPAGMPDGADQPATGARHQRGPARLDDRARHFDRATLDAAGHEGRQDLQHHHAARYTIHLLRNKVTPMETKGLLDRGDGVGLAWAHTAGRGPTVVFLPGFKSDMTGDKATALADFSAARGSAMLRFDYSGHGASGGVFEDGTIGRWRDDALAVIDAQSEGPLILVGSSMGGWIALLAALARPERVAGLIGVAAAPDFTETLIWEAMSFEARQTITRDGALYVPSEYGAPYPITLRLIEEGRSHRLLEGPIAIACPVRLLHGQRDPDVAVGAEPPGRRADHVGRRAGRASQGRGSPPVTAIRPGAATTDAGRTPRPGQRVALPGNSDSAK